jgi:hypothetical protein
MLQIIFSIMYVNGPRVNTVHCAAVCEIVDGKCKAKSLDSAVCIKAIGQQVDGHNETCDLFLSLCFPSLARNASREVTETN